MEYTPLSNSSTASNVVNSGGHLVSQKSHRLDYHNNCLRQSSSEKISEGKLRKESILVNTRHLIGIDPNSKFSWVEITKP